LPDAICLGEALIDFVALESGVTLAQASGFQKAPGGAPANVAVGLAKLSVPTAFIGKVGDDPFGRFMAQTLAGHGVDVSRLRFSRQARTALAFVALTAQGERDFVFYGQPSADMLLEPGEIEPDFIASARAFHCGSITSIREPARSATHRAARIARDAGLLVSYDPNLRPDLWDSLDRAKEEIVAGLDYPALVKVSEEELEFITGTADLSSGARRLLDHPTVRLVAVTRGAGGCFFSTGRCEGAIAGLPVAAVDTTGAGDGFVAALIAGLLAAGGPERLGDLGRDDLARLFAFANAVGALTCTKKGAIPGLPNRAEADAFLASHSSGGPA
jgi:fructokinase